MNDDQAKELYESLKKDARQIAEDARNGDIKAQNVVSLHQMCVQRADIPTVTLLDCAYKDWRKAKDGHNKQEH